MAWLISQYPRVLRFIFSLHAKIFEAVFRDPEGVAQLFPYILDF